MTQALAPQTAAAVTTKASVAAAPAWLTNVMCYGFDMLNANFVSVQIFSSDSTSGNTGNAAGSDSISTFSVPDGVGSVSNPATDIYSSTDLVQSFADFQSDLTGCVSGSFSTICANASGSASFQYAEAMSSSSSSYYAFGFDVVGVATVSRTAPGTLMQGFQSALNALPATLNGSADQDAYNNFFTTYGTHYLTSGVVGGMMVMTTTVDASNLNDTVTQAIAASVSAGFNDDLASGTISASGQTKSTVVVGSSQFSTTSQFTFLGGSASDDFST
jgi:MAC/Perforin domain